MQKITPCLWFDNRIEEAVNFYVSVFKDAKVIADAQDRYCNAQPGLCRLKGEYP